jgi:hypothetical protein
LICGSDFEHFTLDFNAQAQPVLHKVLRTASAREFMTIANPLPIAPDLIIQPLISSTSYLGEFSLAIPYGMSEHIDRTVDRRQNSRSLALEGCMRRFRLYCPGVASQAAESSKTQRWPRVGTASPPKRDPILTP